MAVTTLTATKDTVQKLDGSSGAITFHGATTISSIGIDSGGSKFWSLIGFTLPTFPAGTIVSKAILKLQLIESLEGTLTRNTKVNRLSGSWDETSSSGNPVGVSADQVDVSVTAAAGQKTFDITGIVKAWVEAGASNDGIELGHAPMDSPTVHRYASREHGTASYRPVLEITHNAPPGTPGAFTSPTSGTTYATSIAAAWGASSDPDGNLTGYDVEYTLNNGSTWTRLASNRAGTTYTIDCSGWAATQTAILRVRGVDSNGVVSAWRNSPTFTVNRTPPAPGAFTSPTAGQVVNNSITAAHGGATDPDGQTVTYDWDYSTDGGSTWKNLVNNRTGTSYAIDTSAWPATTTARIRARSRDTFGAVSGYTQTSNFTIQHNAAPNAPGLVAPANNSTHDLANDPPLFDWDFSDPDAGDSQTAWYMRRKINGSTAYEYWNNSTKAWQSTEVKNASTTTSYQFAAAKWTNGNTYNWSVATEDSLGVKGPYASDRTVVAKTPAALTVTAPVGSVTTTTRPIVEWSFTDPASAPQETYQIRLFTAAQYGAAGFDPLTSAATWDSTEITSATDRNRQITTDLVNATTYRAYMRLKVGGLYTAWQYSEFSMALDQPTAPILSVVHEPELGRIALFLDAGNQPVQFTPTNSTFRVEYSDNNGVDWFIVRGCEAVTPDANFDAIVHDYEAPINMARSYRAQVVANV